MIRPVSPGVPTTSVIRPGDHGSGANRRGFWPLVAGFFGGIFGGIFLVVMSQAWTHRLFARPRRSVARMQRVRFAGLQTCPAGGSTMLSRSLSHPAKNHADLVSAANSVWRVVIFMIFDFVGIFDFG